MKTRIAQARKQKRLTQEQLAAIVDVTRQTIISLEQGRYNPSLLLAHRIRKALGTKHIEDLFELD
ncbi:MAG: helix-turn-helix transcriptional regulator [archaeon]